MRYEIDETVRVSADADRHKNRMGTVTEFDDKYVTVTLIGMGYSVMFEHHEVVRLPERSYSLADKAREELDKLNDETDELTADLEAINRADAQVREAIKMAQERIPQIHGDRKEVQKKIQTAENRRSELEAFLKTAATLP